MKRKQKLKLAIPKGSLQNATIEFLGKAGWTVKIKDRSYYPEINDPTLESALLRAQEIPTYVARGFVDCGFTGEDLIRGAKVKVVEIADFSYEKSGLGKVRCVLAVPRGSSIKSVQDLKGKIIATELVGITKEYLKKHNVKAEVRFSWGATEVKTSLDADAIVETVDTGATLWANNLKIIDEVMESSTKFISNAEAWRNPWKRKKMQDIALLFQGVLNAELMMGLMLHVQSKNLKEVLNILPALKKPTVTKLLNGEWYDITVIANKSDVRNIIPKLKDFECQGMVTFPLHQVIF